VTKTIECLFTDTLGSEEMLAEKDNRLYHHKLCTAIYTLQDTLCWNKT